MFESDLIQLLHSGVSWLLQPVIGALLVISAAALWESGTALAERGYALRRLRRNGNAALIETLGRRRIERADLITRIGPMLGLMGTLIPLGPGLAALGEGRLEVLAEAVTVAFDTTVLGLLAGIIGFVLGRLRRRWYDGLLDELQLHHEAR